MSQTTDWLMVIITSIYVIATILICYYNHKSATAAHDQAVEMRKQHEEERRYHMLPWFLISVDEFSPLPDHFKDGEEYKNSIEDVITAIGTDGEAIHLPLYRLKYTVRNIGIGTATRSRYDWHCPDGVALPPRLLYNQSLMQGESYAKTVYLEFSLPNDSFERTNYVFVSTSITFHIYDIYDCEYSQSIGVHFTIHQNGQVEVEIEAGAPR